MSWSLMFVGPLSGPFSWVGEDLAAAVRLAVAEQHQAVDLVLVDAATDDPAAAVTAAAGDRTLGVIGPAFSSSVEALGATIDALGLVFLTPVATKAALAQHGWSHFFRVVAPDSARVPAVVDLLGGQLGLRRVAVVSDRQAAALADAVAGALGETARRITIERGDPDLAGAVRTMAAAQVDGLYFAGEVAEAVGLLQGLADSSLEVAVVGDDGIYNDRFIDTAGSLAEGTRVITTAMAADALDGFATRFAQTERRPPGAFAAEAYLAAQLLLSGLADNRRITPDDLRDGRVVAGRRLAFDSFGEPSPPVLYSHSVERGRWRQLSALTVQRGTDRS